MNPFKMFFEKPLTNTIKTVIGISLFTLFMDVSVHKENSILSKLFIDIEQTRADRAMDQVVVLLENQGETNE